MQPQDYRADQRAQLTTIRTRVEHDAEKQANKAAINEHDFCIHTLYVNPDGHLYWGCEASVNTWNSYDGDYNHPTAQLYQCGTGSQSCSCDLCEEGLDAEDSDDYGEIEQDIIDAMRRAFEQIPVGYFDDED